MTIGKVFKRVLAGAALLATALTGSAQVTARDTRGPALWKVADADTTIYLFGTIHTLPDNAQWRTPAVSDAIAKSDNLVLEILVDNPQATAGLVGSLGITPGLPPLAQRVPAEKREALGKLVASSGAPPAFLDQLETWAAAIMLAGVSFAQAGFSPDQGVEMQLTKLYQQADKPIGALESAEQQLGFLDKLSEKAQRALLAGTVEDPQAVKKELEAMLDAWLTGNVQRIADTFDQETKDSPELQKTLLVRRNQAWADWVSNRMDLPGTIFVAVGAGHLAGKDSLQNMLEKRGIKATRIN